MTAGILDLKEKWVSLIFIFNSGTYSAEFWKTIMILPLVLGFCSLISYYLWFEVLLKYLQVDCWNVKLYIVFGSQNCLVLFCIMLFEFDFRGTSNHNWWCFDLTSTFGLDFQFFVVELKFVCGRALVREKFSGNRGWSIWNEEVGFSGVLALCLCWSLGALFGKWDISYQL